MARRPVQVIMGGEVSRSPLAVVCWARRCQLSVASVYNAIEVDPQQGPVIAELIRQL